MLERLPGATLIGMSTEPQPSSRTEHARTAPLRRLSPRSLGVWGGAALCVTLAAVAAVLLLRDDEDEHTVRVTRAEVDPWPLTVDEGSLHCDYSGAVSIEVDGTSYGLNDIALNEGHAALDPIWADAPAADAPEASDRQEGKMSVNALVNHGIALCS